MEKQSKIKSPSLVVYEVIAKWVNEAFRKKKQITSYILAVLFSYSFGAFSNSNTFLIEMEKVGLK